MSEYYLEAAYARLYPITTGKVPPASLQRRVFTSTGYDGQPFDTPAVSLEDAIRWVLLTDDTDVIDDIDAFFEDFVVPSGVDILDNPPCVEYPGNP